MPPYFNLLFVISSRPSLEVIIFVHIIQRRDSGDTAVRSAVPPQNGSQASKMARTLGILGVFSAGWCTIPTRTENRTHPLKLGLYTGSLFGGPRRWYLLPSYYYLVPGKKDFCCLMLCTKAVPPAPLGRDIFLGYPAGAKHRRCSYTSLYRYAS